MNNLLKNLGLKTQILALIGSSTVALVVIRKLFLAYKKNAQIEKSRKFSQEQAERKRKEREQAINKLKLSEANPKVEHAIDNLSIRAISGKLRDKDFTSVDLVTVLIRRTIQIGVKHNLISDVLFQEALNRAKECDNEREQALKNGKQLSLLHGIPISVKDHIFVKSTSSNWCHCQNLYPVKQEDAVLIKILKKAGAIPFVKSATPSNSSINTCSYLWGQATLPQDVKRTPGGSSGGQGGLISARASLIGIGSDSGGSLRIPAAWCGIATLYPTTQRMPYGKIGGKLGKDNKNASSMIKSTPGPLAKFTDDLAIFLQNTYSEMAYRLSLKNVPLVFNSEAYFSNDILRIGYFYDCDIFTSCPSAHRALDIAIKSLKNQGHQLVPFNPGSLKNVLKLTYQLSAYDQSKHAAQSLLSEPQGSEQVKEVIKNSKKSRKQILERKKKLLEKGDRLGYFVYPQIRGQEHMQKLVERYDYIKDLRNRMAGMQNDERVSQPIHVLICPTMPYPAPLTSMGRATYLTTAFTCISNLAEMPSGSVPVTRVEQGEQEWDPVLNGNQPDDTLSQDIRNAMRNSVGLPMGVQVLGSPFRDEMVLRIMREIEVGANFYEK